MTKESMIALAKIQAQLMTAKNEMLEAGDMEALEQLESFLQGFTETLGEEIECYEED